MKKVRKATIIHERTMTAEESKAAGEELERYIADRMAYLKRFGYTSGEGFFIDDEGVPRSISEDD